MVQLDRDKIEKELESIREKEKYQHVKSRSAEQVVGISLSMLPDKHQELFELLGGEELYHIFDKSTVGGIMYEYLITNKLHPCINDTQGFEILEGLLNKQITGNLGKFYNILPSYIVSLNSSEQAKMATTFAEGHKDLEETLKVIWGRGIETIDCSGDSEGKRCIYRIKSTYYR